MKKRGLGVLPCSQANFITIDSRPRCQAHPPGDCLSAVSIVRGRWVPTRVPTYLRVTVGTAAGELTASSWPRSTRRCKRDRTAPRDHRPRRLISGSLARSLRAQRRRGCPDQWLRSGPGAARRRPAVWRSSIRLRTAPPPQCAMPTSSCSRCRCCATAQMRAPRSAIEVSSRLRHAVTDVGSQQSVLADVARVCGELPPWLLPRIRLPVPRRSGLANSVLDPVQRSIASSNT